MAKKKRGPDRLGIIKDLQGIKKAMDARGVPFVLMYGLCLGCVRHGDVMEWDTDIDIGIFIELTEKQRQGIYKSLMTIAGYRYMTPKGDFIYSSKSVPLNLWLYHKEGEYYKAYPSTTGRSFILKAKWFDNPVNVNFLGDEYLIPNNVFDYLTCHYGNWREEIIKSHPEWLRLQIVKPMEWPRHEPYK